MKIQEKIHPLTLFTYFVLIIMIIMFTNNPILLLLFLIGGLINYGFLTSFNECFKSLIFYLILIILSGIINTFFSNEGKTIIMIYEAEKKYITMESLFYGMGIGLMISGVLCWFRNYNIVVGNDKFIYLFGKILPNIALVIVMALRFIPLYMKQMKKNIEIQKILGYTAKSKIKTIVRAFSSVMVWSFENAIDTAYSMKMRGYGLELRTNMNMYKFRKTDLIILLIELVLGLMISYLIINGNIDFLYYPVIKMNFNILLLIVCCSSTILINILLFMELKEAVRWHYLNLKM